MGKIIETIIDRLDGGMVNDPRVHADNVATIIKHLDTSDPHRLIQHPDNDATASDRANTAFDTVRIQQFIYANYLVTPTFFGLGVQSGTQKPSLFTKPSVADGAAWAAANTTGDHATLTALGGAGMAGPVAFVLYQNYLYGIDGNGWWKYGDLADLSTATWTRLVYTSTFLNVSPPIVHSKEDVMYGTGGQGTLVQNRIIKNNAGSWSTPLVFGLYTKLPSVCEFGNFIAIAANEPNGTSNVYLWDQDSSLATLTEKINWGSGEIKFIEQVGGVLVGCSILQPSTFSITPEVVFKYYNGQEAVEFARFKTTAGTVYPYKQLFNNMVYFLAEMTIKGVALRGVWKIVKGPTGFSVCFDRMPRLDDTITAGKLYGFLRTGDYFHIACANAQSSDAYVVTKTGATYTGSAIRDTKILTLGDASRVKKLIGATVMHEALPAAGAVTLSYKKDEEFSYTEIFNSTADNAMKKSGVKSSAGVNLPQFHEISFRLTITGNAVVTGIRFKAEVLETDVY